MEDLIGGHYWVGIYLIIGGVWHIHNDTIVAFGEQEKQILIDR